MGPLRFYPATHRYKLHGKWIPGVTTLIKGGLPAPALMYWSARTVAEWVADNEAALEQMRTQMGRGPLVAALKEVPWQKRDEASAKGTEVHALGEKLAHGEEVDVPEHIAGYVAGYVRWLDAAQPEVLHTECRVYSEQWWYAGTFDLLARLYGQTWLLDLKTSRGIYGEAALQLAAYSHAEQLVVGDDDPVPMPRIDRLGVLHVQDGETTLYPLTDTEAAWKDFLHVAWVAKAENRIKSYIGQPIESAEDGAA